MAQPSAPHTGTSGPLTTSPRLPLVAPEVAPIPTLAAAPTLAPRPPEMSQLETAIAAVSSDFVPVLPTATPTAPPAGAPATPVHLAAALDAAGAPVARPAQNGPARRAAQGRAARRKRAKRNRIRIVCALVVLAGAALVGPTAVRWAIDQVDGGTEPIAPATPVTVPALDAG